MIDWTRVTELRDEIGPEDFHEVAELFLMEVEDTLGQLSKATNDPPQMQELLHFLKGSALNLGFRQVSALCNQGETDAAEGKITIDIDALKTLYAKSRAEFEAEFHERYVA